MGFCVDAVVHGRTALEKLLRDKGHKHRHVGGGKAALNLYLVDAQRQAGHKALFLLVVQPDKRAVILLCHTCGLEHIVAQLLLGVGHIQHKKGQHEKPFVPGLQFVQQLFGVLAVSGKVAGQDVHVVPGTDSLFLLLNLHGVKVCDLPLDGFDGLGLADGLHMEIDENAAFRFEKIGQHFIRKFRRKDL